MILTTVAAIYVFSFTGCGSTDTNIAQGMQQIQELDYQGALDSFVLAAEQEENGKLLYRGQGIAYMGMTKYDEAAESFLKALSNLPAVKSLIISKTLASRLFMHTASTSLFLTHSPSANAQTFSVSLSKVFKSLPTQVIR